MVQASHLNQLCIVTIYQQLASLISILSLKRHNLSFILHFRVLEKLGLLLLLRSLCHALGCISFVILINILLRLKIVADVDVIFQDEFQLLDLSLHLILRPVLHNILLLSSHITYVSDSCMFNCLLYSRLIFLPFLLVFASSRFFLFL